MVDCSMKRILIITTFLLVTFAASAQTSDAELVQCGIRICQNGQKLKYRDLKNLCDFDLNTYQDGRLDAIMGITFISIGALPSLIGLYGIIGMIDEHISNNQQPCSGLGEMAVLYGGGLGLLFEGIGIPLLISGKKTIRRAANGYNSSRNIDLSMNFSRNGIGLTLTF